MPVPCGPRAFSKARTAVYKAAQRPGPDGVFRPTVWPPRLASFPWLCPKQFWGLIRVLVCNANTSSNIRMSLVTYTLMCSKAIQLISSQCNNELFRTLASCRMLRLG